MVPKNAVREEISDGGRGVWLSVLPQAGFHLRLETAIFLRIWTTSSGYTDCDSLWLCLSFAVLGASQILQRLLIIFIEVASCLCSFDDGRQFSERCLRGVLTLADGAKIAVVRHTGT